MENLIVNEKNIILAHDIAGNGNYTKLLLKEMPFAVNENSNYR